MSRSTVCRNIYLVYFTLYIMIDLVCEGTLHFLPSTVITDSLVDSSLLAVWHLFKSHTMCYSSFTVIVRLLNALFLAF